MAHQRSQSGPGAPTLTAGVAEIRALAHPLRLRILELFAEGPRTTKQIADLLREPPTRLYHHVAALERAGLIRLKETRKNRGTVEKWYETAAKTMGVSQFPLRAPTRRSKGESAAKRALALTVLAQSRQEVAAAMSPSGGGPPMVVRLVAVAPPARLAELRKRLFTAVRDVIHEFDCSDESASSDVVPDRWAVTLTFAPTSGAR